MRTKLIKIKDGYELFTQGFLKGSTNHELIDSLNVEEGNIRYKLSLKNCQAIERGYDLNELISESNTSHLALFTSDSHELMYDEGFKAGFLKALELMGDKKFSEDDLRLAMHFGKFGEANNQTTTIGFIQSLQQTEWEVEIMMDMILIGQCHCPCHSEGATIMHYMACCNPKMVESPKLDADGCLILKKI